MSRRRFQLTSEQLELLLAFGQIDGLANLASLMAKDPSVISRNLQRLAETAPVLSKKAGRWHITPLGQQICAKADAFARELESLLEEFAVSSTRPSAFPPATLVVINAQRALLDPVLGGRSTPDAEANIAKLLVAFRSRGDRVFHVRHVSENPSSPYFLAGLGVALLPTMGPTGNEPVIDKKSASGFAGTTLAAAIEATGVATVVFAGFTANECIDATARHASEAGFQTFVVSDATATFDLRGPDGKLHAAERVHQLTLANLHAHVATVLKTDDVIKRLMPLR